jgi:hypothetical protein
MITYITEILEWQTFKKEKIVRLSPIDEQTVLLRVNVNT